MHNNNQFESSEVSSATKRAGKRLKTINNSYEAQTNVFSRLNKHLSN